jgi:uncharacterized OB-fold protein
MSLFFRPPPALEPYTEAFWRACRAGRLEMARCAACGWYIHPARPICPRCRGNEIGVGVLSGRAQLHSFTINHKAWFPGQAVPYAIGLVELVEQRDLRLTTNIVNCPLDRIAIGMPLRVTFEIVNDDIALPLFEPLNAAVAEGA